VLGRGEARGKDGKKKRKGSLEFLKAGEGGRKIKKKKARKDQNSRTEKDRRASAIARKKNKKKEKGDRYGPPGQPEIVERAATEGALPWPVGGAT